MFRQPLQSFRHVINLTDSTLTPAAKLESIMMLAIEI